MSMSFMTRQIKQKLGDCFKKVQNHKTKANQVNSLTATFDPQPDFVLSLLQTPNHTRVFSRGIKCFETKE